MQRVASGVMQRIRTLTLDVIQALALTLDVIQALALTLALILLVTRKHLTVTLTVTLTLVFTHH